MLLVLFQNGFDGKEKGTTVPQAAMDIMMSTETPENENKEIEGWKTKYDDLRKKYGLQKKMNTGLLGLIAGREREGLTSRLNAVLEGIGDEDKEAKSRIKEMIDGVDKIEFQLDVSTNKLKKTPFESELELLESYSEKISKFSKKKKTDEEEVDPNSERYEVPPEDEEDDGSMTPEKVDSTLEALGY